MSRPPANRKGKANCQPQRQPTQAEALQPVSAPCLATDQLVQLRAAAMPARVTFIPGPSAKVPMQNTQVRLPEHIADKLRMLAAMTRQKQQAMMERWITRGVEEEWRRVTQAD